MVQLESDSVLVPPCEAMLGRMSSWLSGVTDVSSDAAVPPIEWRSLDAVAVRRAHRLLTLRHLEGSIKDAASRWRQAATLASMPDDLWNIPWLAMTTTTTTGDDDDAHGDDAQRGAGGGHRSVLMKSKNLFELVDVQFVTASPRLHQSMSVRQSAVGRSISIPPRRAAASIAAATPFNWLAPAALEDIMIFFHTVVCRHIGVTCGVAATRRAQMSRVLSVARRPRRRRRPRPRTEGGWLVGGGDSLIPWTEEEPGNGIGSCRRRDDGADNGIEGQQRLARWQRDAPFTEFPRVRPAASVLDFPSNLPECRLTILGRRWLPLLLRHASSTAPNISPLTVPPPPPSKPGLAGFMASRMRCVINHAVL